MVDIIVAIQTFTVRHLNAVKRAYEKYLKII